MSEVNCAMFSPECAGRLEWHHAIKQQRIRREFKYGALWQGGETSWVPAPRYACVQRSDDHGRLLSDILGDERNRVWLCSHHHELVTNSRVQVVLPESVWDFAAEFGLTAMLENDLARRSAA